MEINHLKEFVLLAEMCNFAEAAHELYTTQSSLSKHIKKLEGELGYSLFDRTTRRVTLSSRGADFLIYAKKIVSIYEEYIVNFSEKLEHEIIIGSIPSMFEYNITDIIADFKEENNVNIKIVQSSSDHLENMLRNGKCDFAFIKQPEDSNEEFIKIPYSSDFLVAVLPKKHLLSKKKNIRISDLKDEHFLLQPENSRPYNLCIESCRKEGFNPDIIYTDSQLSNIIDLVSKGMGISLLMKKLVLPVYSSVATVDIIPKISISVSLCFCKKYRLSKMSQLFLKYLNSRNLDEL